MAARPILVLAAATAFAALPVAAQSVAVTGAATRIAEPGERLTLVFRVQGRGAAAQVLHADVSLPRGWYLVSGSGPVAVRAGESATHLVSIALPAGALAGRYQVALHVGDAPPRPGGGGAPPAASANVLVEVHERARLELELIDEPRFVIAGTPYQIRASLRNSGNTPIDAGLDAGGARGRAVQLDLTQFLLLPGQSRIVTATVVSGDAGRLASRQEVTITARRTGVRPGADSATATVVSRVRVVPRAASGTARPHAIPFYAAIRGAGPLGGGRHAVRGTTAEVGGHGRLVDGGATSLELLVRRSDEPRAPFSVRDEYRLALTGPWGELLGGHHFYGISPLTRTGRLQLGGGGSVRRDWAMAGGYVVRDPDALIPAREEAAFVGVRLPIRLDLFANVVARHDDSLAVLRTVRAVVGPTPLGRFDVETALPSSSRAGEPAAWSVRAQGEPWGFTYDVQHLTGGDGWLGPYRGALERYATVSTPARFPLRLYGQTTERTIGHAADLGRIDSLPGATAWTQSFMLTRVGVALGRWVRVERRTASQVATLAATRFEREESAWVTRGQVRVRRALSVAGEFASGEGRDAATPETRPFWRAAGDATLRLGRLHSLSINGEHQVTQGDAGDVARASVGAVLALALPWTGSDVRLGARRNSGPGISLSSEATVASLVSMIYEGEFRQRLPFGQTLSLRVRSVESPVLPGARQSVGVLELRMPFRVPAGLAREGGPVVLTVRDAESGAGVPNVLISLGGQAVVTDSRGRATFAALAAGVYGLQVDRLSLGAGRISDYDEPVPVRVVDGARTEVTITVMRGARLEGLVERYDLPERTRLADTVGLEPVLVGGVPGLVVEVANGSVTRRRSTDALGRFLFDQLPPGEWSVRIVGGELPELHRLANESMRVTLLPGGAQTVSLHVLPQIRTIRMISPEARRDARREPDRRRDHDPDPKEPPRL